MEDKALNKKTSLTFASSDVRLSKVKPLGFCGIEMKQNSAGRPVTEVHAGPQHARQMRAQRNPAAACMFRKTRGKGWVKERLDRSLMFSYHKHYDILVLNFIMSLILKYLN
jgi:hypothetical protein